MADNRGVSLVHPVVLSFRSSRLFPSSMSPPTLCGNSEQFVIETSFAIRRRRLLRRLRLRLRLHEGNLGRCRCRRRRLRYRGRRNHPTFWYSIGIGGGIGGGGGSDRAASHLQSSSPSSSSSSSVRRENGLNIQIGLHS